MRSSFRVVVLMTIVLLFASACAMMSNKLGIRQEGEMRLVQMRVPDVMHKDLPYKVEVAFEADGRPEIRSVCFQWLSLNVPVKSPNLYCYAKEVEGNKPIGEVCNRLVDEGVYDHVSALACTKAEIVRYGTPGSFVVTLGPENVKPIYNALECRVEYAQDGQVRQTNKISANVIVSEGE